MSGHVGDEGRSGGSAGAPGGGLAGRLLHARWFVRAPIWLYRLRLGALLGPRLILVEHVGRVSGARRLVVLEVVEQDAARWVVASGFGERSQWFRNLVAHPGARVQAGSRRPVDVVARRLDPDEARAVLASYAQRHPKAWARLRPVIEQAVGAPVDADDVRLPLVALER